MKPVEILVFHRGRIQQLFSETGSWPKTYETMKSEFSEFAGMRLATFKQYSPILIELNKQLNNSEQLNTELNTVKQELEQVKHELNRLQELNTKLNKELQLNKLNKLNNQGLNMPVKHGLNIAGWSIQESKGYFRAFKKVAGKMQAVYLGKNLDDAEQKIRNKAGGDPG